MTPFSILVCVKQVPDPETLYEIRPDRTRAVPRHELRYQMNRLDEFAVEAAIRFAQHHPGVRTEALTVGPERTAVILERSRGMGIDGALHVVHSEAEEPSAEEVAGRITRVARNRSPDLILTGMMSEDRMQGLVGPLVAGYLDWPVVVGVVSIEEQGGRIRVERERTGGRREPIELEPPAVFCLQSGPHRPRYPSLSRLLRAKKTPPTRIDASSLVVPPGRALVMEAGLPEKRRTGKILEGTPREKAARLLRILNEKNLIHFKETR